MEAHADDLIVVGPDLDAVVQVKQGIMNHCEVRDLGEVTNFLGMEVKWDRAAGTASLANPRHIQDLLLEYKLQDCNPVKTPMAQGVEFGSSDALPKGHRYAELVGSLLYLANQTRPEIAFAVGRLARRMSQSTEGDWALSKRFLRYLKGTVSMGIKYGGAQTLGGWVDSDFAGDLDTRMSTTGYVFTLHGGAASWRSGLQRLVATSNTTEEYIAAAKGVKESPWLRRVVRDMGNNAGPVPLREDSQACIAMAGHVACFSLTKHVYICYHFLHDCIARGQAVLEYIASAEQLANGFIKPLPPVAFTLFRQRIGVCNVRT